MDSLAAAADGSHLSGAMIALVPTPEDAERLAVEGGEAADQLHLTLYFLGDDGTAWTEDQRNELIGNLRAGAADLTPISARVFGANHWNAGSDSPSWVWAVGDDRNRPLNDSTLEAARWVATYALEDTHERPDLPVQHSPWQPHICAAYSDELDLIIALEERLGPVTFDRIRVAFAGDHTDIPLDVSMTAAAGPLRRQPTELEVASRVDFAEMDKAWHDAVNATVAAWTDIQTAQREQITAAVQAAAEADDLDRLDGFTPDTGDAERLLIARMIAYARQAGEQQQAEAEAQGVTVPDWSLDDEAITAAAIRDRLRQIGRTAARVLGVELVQSAVRQAMRVWGSGTASQVAAQVDEHLASLSGAAVEEQVGAAMTAAQNEGRMAVLAVAPAATYTATEILDKNSCLAPEVLVTTRDGRVPAKDVTLDDQLLTHSGRWIEPSRIVVSHVEEELTRVHLAGGRSLRLTWDHPVLVRDGDSFAWRNAGDLAVGDLVVDQSTLELGGEFRGVDLVFGEAPDDVSPVAYVGGLSAVDVGAQAVPVGAVSLDHKVLADEEVHDPRTDLDLGSVDVPKVFEGLADASLDAGLGVAGAVAPHRAVPLTGCRRGNDAELGAAVVAVDEDGWPTARLGAEGASLELGVPEGSAASLADCCSAPCVSTALDGAVGISGVVGDGDAELSVAVGADLRDSVRTGADLCAHLGVGVLALNRAVDSAGPLLARDLSAAHLAERRCEVRVASQPRRLDRTTLAERATLDCDTTCHTRLVHDLSLQVDAVKPLVITAIERESYAGDVYDFTVPEDETFWAEGVLVHNCKPCRDIDGTKYTSLEDARKAYPTGGYTGCLGGARCRGTLVTVWPSGSDQAAAGMILAASAATIPPTQQQGGTVPYSIVQDHPDCGADTPWAVTQTDTNELMGCHDTEAAAAEQLAALNAAEDTSSSDEPADDGDESMDYTGQTAPWEGPLAVEGIVTGDGREFAPGALTWAELPVPLRWNIEDSHGGEARTKAVNVGRIDKVWRDGDKIMGAGVLDLSDDNGRRAHAKIEGKFLRGVSIDADSIADADVEFVWPDDVNAGTGDSGEDDDLFEMLFAQPEKVVFHGGRIRAATLVDIPAFAEAYIALLDEAGAVVAGGQPVTAAELTELRVQEMGAVGTHDTATSDGPWDAGVNEKRIDGPLTVDKARAAYGWYDGAAVEDGEMPKSAAKFLHHEINADGSVGAANLAACSAAIGALHGARGGASIPDADRRGVYDHVAAHLRDAGQEPAPFRSLKPVTASAMAEVFRPPVDWFTDPKLSLPTPITITDDGRIYGHAAQWGSCHIGQDDVCVQPPHEDAHPYYRTGEVVCADGSRVAVGQITVGTGHAPLHYGASPAAEHYDNTGAAVADVAVGNDAHGIWVAGAIRPGADPLKVYELQAAGQVSGDWRRIGGALRLVGLLGVNVPGFPVPKMRARVASGEPQALLAAGRPTVAWGRSQDALERDAVRIVMRMLSRRVHPGR
jgi:2'-5' RNA ligase